jgi:hypothetical protein
MLVDHVVNVEQLRGLGNISLYLCELTCLIFSGNGMLSLTCMLGVQRIVLEDHRDVSLVARVLGLVLAVD